MAIGEVLLGSFLNVLFDRLTSPKLLDFARRENIHSLLGKWKRTLLSIQAVLEEAEERAMDDETRVQLWLDDLRDLAYDIEDLLDLFATKEGLYNSSTKLTTGEVRSRLPTLSAALDPQKFMFNNKMRSDIEGIDHRMKDIIAEKRDLGLHETGGGRSWRKNRRLPTTCLVESHVFGREEAKTALLKLLEFDDLALSVIPIVGMPGVGKTTLAQFVYNDDMVKGSFSHTAWASVSEEFDVLGITRTILQSISHGDYEGVDLNVLQIKLKYNLFGKKFLIILDDVWNENYSTWTLLLRPFESGAKGSKIIITTQNRVVASITGTVPFYHLNVLTSSDSLSLFAHHALGVGNFDANLCLKSTGEKIVAKCQGLPLAAKTFGGLLRRRINLHEWEALLESEIWSLQNERNSIFPDLKQSYARLPSYLKRCFAYCAVFPKGYEFCKDELVLLWMAEGLLERNNSRNGYWDHGLKCFDALLSRSFFQESTNGGSKFVMHSLMNDLARAIAGPTCLSLGASRLDAVQGLHCLEKARHLSFISCNHEVLTRFDGHHNLKRLRTFLPMNLQSKLYFISNTALDDLLQHLKFLRVLSLCGYAISELPYCIGNLKLLRYINLSRTFIQKLPESASSLCNLEALILRRCFLIRKLPDFISKLHNLRYLDIQGTHLLQEVPSVLGDSANLEIHFPDFIVGKDEGPNLKDLKYLSYLQEKLVISDLENVEEAGDAKEVKLYSKHNLRSLILKWGGNLDLGVADKRSLQVFQFLQPHPNLEELRILGYGGTDFPSWIRSQSFVNMTSLKLINCQKIRLLPSVASLPLLKELEIDGMPAVYTVGPEFLGNMKPFPSLEILKFKRMAAWKDWCFSTGAEEFDEPFPRLRELELEDCPILTGNLPRQLHSLLKLKMSCCPQLGMAESFMVSLPSLHELQLEDCNEAILSRLIHLNSLTKVYISRISQLSLPERFLTSLIALEELEIKDCNGMVYLWHESIGNLPRLKRLTIHKCHQVVQLLLPCNVEYLSLKDCENLMQLPDNFQSLTSLKEVRISRCAKLMSLPKEAMMCRLEILRIRSCRSLTSFSEGKAPTTLRTLRIFDCEKLERLPEGIILPHDHGASSNCESSQLEALNIVDCPSLMPIPEGMLPSTLKTLKIEESGDFEFLAGIIMDYEHNLSVEEINIRSCNIQGLSQHLDRFISLTSLHMKRCHTLTLDPFPRFQAACELSFFGDATISCLFRIR